MTETANYKFTKPDGFERMDISVLNSNFDKIDEAIFNKVDKKEGESLMTEEEHNKLSGIDNDSIISRLTALETKNSELEARIKVLEEAKKE